MLNRQNLLIAKFGGDPVLPGVGITPAETLVTDGTQLLLVTVQASDGPAIDGLRTSEVFRPFVISKEKALEIAAAVPDVCDCIAVDASDERRIVLSVTDLETPRIFAIEPLVSRVPEWRRAIRSEQPPAAVIEIDADRLVALVKHLRAFLEGGREMRSSKQGIRLEIRPGKPDVLTLIAESDEGQKMTAVVVGGRR